MRSLRLAWMGLCTALWAAVANAQALPFGDDFESGTLSGWSALDVVPGVTFAADPAAAHRGAYGARLVDSDADAGAATTQGQLSQTLNPLTGAVYARFWMRLSSSNDQGSFIKVSQLQGTASLSTLTELAVNYPGTELSFDSFDFSSNVETSQHTGRRLDAGEWHLFEFDIEGMGTADGGSRLWLDGDPMGQYAGVNWTGATISQFTLGECWGDPAWAGTLDFDDPRLSATPLASTLVLTPATLNPRVNDCVPVGVGLKDSVAGANAAVPYGFGATLTADGGGLFASSTCATPVTTAALAPGQQSQVFFQPHRAGTVWIGVSAIDFLPASATLVVGPFADGGPASDGGATATPSIFAVSCGGAPASDCGLGVVWGAALALVLRRAQGPRWRR